MSITAVYNPVYALYRRLKQYSSFRFVRNSGREPEWQENINFTKVKKGETLHGRHTTSQIVVKIDSVRQVRNTTQKQT